MGKDFEKLVNWDSLALNPKKFHQKDYPSVSVVIPIDQPSKILHETLQSILSQDYPDVEIIIVNSSDKPFELPKDWQMEQIRIYNVEQSYRYVMLNKGVSQAKGEYINFLFPGDFYLYHKTIETMMLLALEKKKPDLVYSGTLIRDGRSEAKILYRDFTLDLLKQGQQPTSLQSCWFKTDSLRKLGKFNSNYTMRGGFDLMCRFRLNESLNFASLKRIFTDYDLRMVTRNMVLSHFLETFKTIYTYFGFFASLRWLLFYQKDWLRFVKLWLRALRGAFFGR